MTLRLLTLLSFFVLAACASSPLAPGKCVQYVECPDGMDDCHQQARDLCPGGYHQLQDSDVGADFGDFAKQHFDGARDGTPHIVVTCN